MEIDIIRARITHPSGIVSPARFVFFSDNGDNVGTAAVWQEDRRHRSAARALFASSATYEPGKTPRHSSAVVLEDGQRWTINPLSGGCSCRNKTSLLSSYEPRQLLDPDNEQVTD